MLDSIFFYAIIDNVLILNEGVFIYMVKIRLQRFGAHKAPKYRIVAADSKSPRDGKFLEILGTYNPLTNPATVTVDAEKVQAWISKGAQVTITVKNILVANNVISK